MTAPTPPPERKCRRCGATDNLRVVIDVLGVVYKSWECRGGCPTLQPAPLDLAALERLERLERRATDGPWRVVADDSESITTVWQACTSPDHPAEDGPDRIGVYDCCADGGLHGEPFYTEADAELIAALRNAAPELIRRARERDEARADAERYRNSLPATTQDYWHWRKRAEATERELVERGRQLTEARAEADRLRPVVDAARTWRHGGGEPGYDAGAALDHAVDAYEALPERVGGRWLATWSITGPVERVAEQASIALAQMASEYADAGPVKLRAELRADGGDPR